MTFLPTLYIQKGLVVSVGGIQRVIFTERSVNEWGWVYLEELELLQRPGDLGQPLPSTPPASVVISLLFRGGFVWWAG